MIREACRTVVFLLVACVAALFVVGARLVLLMDDAHRALELWRARREGWTPIETVALRGVRRQTPTPAKG